MIGRSESQRQLKTTSKCRSKRKTAAKEGNGVVRRSNKCPRLDYQDEDVVDGASDIGELTPVAPDLPDLGSGSAIEALNTSPISTVTTNCSTNILNVPMSSLRLGSPPKRRPSKRADSSSRQQEIHLSVPSHRYGDLLAFGEGDTGQLGMGQDVMQRKKPQLVNIDNPVIQVAAGGMHSIALDSSGIVYSWGCNDDFALGRITSSGANEEDSLEFTPAPVQLAKKAVQISAGDSHSAALLEDGSVFVWGAFRDTNGLIGLQRSKMVEKKPIRVDVRCEHIVKISSGSDHMAVLTSGGSVYTFGNAQQGQLGRVGRYSSDKGGRSGLGKLLEPDIMRCQSYRDIRRPKHFVDVWCGPYSTFVKEDSTKRILACGLNNFYQLGHVHSDCHYALVPILLDKTKRWIKIAAGMHHTLALNSDGEVYAFGRHEYGRLGLGFNSDVVVEPTKIEQLPVGDDPIVDIACGSAVSFAISRSGKAYSWGMGTNCQTGHGDEDVEYPKEMKSKQLDTRNVLQIDAGGQHTLMIARSSNVDEMTIKSSVNG